jgi:uncharacterized protein
MSPGLLQPAPYAPVGLRGRRHDLAWFYLSTFGLTWGVAAACLLARPQLEAVFGTSSTLNPLYVVAVASPSIVAVVLTAVRGGAAGLVELGRRVFRWRVPWRCYALVLLGWPAMDYLARLLQWAATGERPSLVPFATVPPLDGLPWFVVPSLLVSTLLLDAGPLGEEVGQRGYVLPRILARHPPLVAAVAVGVVWGVWRLPVAYIAGSAPHVSALHLGWLVLGATVSSVLMTWLSLRTRGSVLVAGVLVHLMNDVTVADHRAFVVIALVVAVPAAVSLHRAGASVGRVGVGPVVSERRPRRQDPWATRDQGLPS